MCWIPLRACPGARCPDGNSSVRAVLARTIPADRRDRIYCRFLKANHVDLKCSFYLLVLRSGHGVQIARCIRRIPRPGLCYTVAVSLPGAGPLRSPGNSADCSRGRQGRALLRPPCAPSCDLAAAWSTRPATAARRHRMGSAGLARRALDRRRPAGTGIDSTDPRSARCSHRRQLRRQPQPDVRQDLFDHRLPGDDRMTPSDTLEVPNLGSRWQRNRAFFRPYIARPKRTVFGHVEDCSSAPTSG